MTFPDSTLLRLRRRRVDQRAYLGHAAEARDCHRLIRSSTLIYDVDERRLVLAYLRLDDDPRLERLAQALPGVQTTRQVRMSGLVTHSTTFGYAPRNATRQPYCSQAKLARTHRKAHALLIEAADLVAQAYAWFSPSRYADHLETTERVLPEWRLAETAFTSGVLNRNSALAYHFDAGNITGGWSGMLGFRHEMAGGWLAIPVYDLALEVADRSLTLFDGQSLVHGVTPLDPLTEDAYRLTAVYYARAGMWDCLTGPEEVAYAQRVSTERERRRRSQRIR